MLFPHTGKKASCPGSASRNHMFSRVIYQFRATPGIKSISSLRLRLWLNTVLSDHHFASDCCFLTEITSELTTSASVRLACSADSDWAIGFLNMEQNPLNTQAAEIQEISKAQFGINTLCATETKTKSLISVPATSPGCDTQFRF